MSGRRVYGGTHHSEDTSEKEYSGKIRVLKDGFGFLNSNSGQPQIYFVRDEHCQFQVGEEVTYRVVSSPKGLVALDLKVEERKADKMAKSFLESGQMKEQGVIDTIRGDYGFIKRTEHHKNIYFHFDDLIDSKTRIRPGYEVEFFVIDDTPPGNKRGGGSSSTPASGTSKLRAACISILPTGTVQMELSLLTAARAVVISQPRLLPKEEPGILRLLEPIDISEQLSKHRVNKLNYESSLASSDGNFIERVELWPRCMPEDMIVREGDILTIDVKNYRPDALIFARKIKIDNYRKLGREEGVIRSLKADGGFGFITSRTGGGGKDVYFRMSDFNNFFDGLSKEIKVDLVVTYDLITEDSRGEMRFRAIRLKEEPNTPNGLSKLKIGCKGIVNNTTRHHGIISLNKTGFSAIELEDINSQGGNDMAHISLVQGLKEFQSNPDLDYAHLEFLSASQTGIYSRLIEEKFKDISCEIMSSSQSSSIIDGSGYRAGVYKSIKLRKRKEDVIKSIESLSVKEEKQQPTKPGDDVAQSLSNISFSRSEADESIGPISKDAEVDFDLWVDKTTGQFIAQKVRLTLEMIEPTGDGFDDPATGFSAGVIESYQYGKYGFVRRIPDDQKLFWHISDCIGVDPNAIGEGARILFRVARKGGARCAINIQLIPFGSATSHLPLGDLPWNENIVEGDCRALAVSDKEVIVIDTSACPLYHKKVWDYASAIKIHESSKVGTGEVFPITVFASKKAADSDCKFFPILKPSKMPVLLLEERSDLVVGEVITCQLIANWYSQRHPIRAIEIAKSKEGPSEILAFRKGIITKEKFVINSVELCEITENLSGEKQTGDAGRIPARSVFYCDARDIQSKRSRILLSKGSEVKFIGHQETGLAYQVAPFDDAGGDSAQVTGSIVFKRAPINRELIQQQAAKGLGQKERITMAKRPQNEESLGFESGWRSIPDISKLGWQKLLTHLQ